MRKIEVHPDEVEKLAAIGASAKEIATRFSISESTIKHKYAEAFARGHVNFRLKIRAAQLKKALEKGDSTMLIWLGKQYLGQADKQELEHDGKLEIVVRLVDKLNATSTD